MGGPKELTISSLAMSGLVWDIPKIVHEVHLCEGIQHPITLYGRALSKPNDLLVHMNAMVALRETKAKHSSVGKGDDIDCVRYEDRAHSSFTS